MSESESQDPTPSGGSRDEYWEDLPICSNTHVLGVDIAVPQQAHHEKMSTGDYYGGLYDVDITTWQGGIGLSRIERDLSHWARRNLFDGLPSQRSEGDPRR